MIGRKYRTNKKQTHKDTKDLTSLRYEVEVRHNVIFQDCVDTKSEDLVLDWIREQ